MLNRLPRHPIKLLPVEKTGYQYTHGYHNSYVQYKCECGGLRRRLDKTYWLNITDCDQCGITRLADIHENYYIMSKSIPNFRSIMIPYTDIFAGAETRAEINQVLVSVKDKAYEYTRACRDRIECQALLEALIELEEKTMKWERNSAPLTLRVNLNDIAPITVRNIEE